MPPPPLPLPPLPLSPRLRMQVLQHFAPPGSMEEERLAYFATAEGRDDLYRQVGLARPGMEARLVEYAEGSGLGAGPRQLWECCGIAAAKPPDTRLPATERPSPPGTYSPT